MAKKPLLMLVQQLYEALDAEDQTKLVAVSAVFRSNLLLLGELQALLPEEARPRLISQLRYGHAWSLSYVGKLFCRPQPHAVIAARREGRDYQAPPARPAPWKSTEHQRGMLRGFLAQVVATLRPRRTRSSAESKRRKQSLDMQAVSAVEMFEDSSGPHFKPEWTVADVAKALEVGHSALVGNQRDGTPRCPKFQKLRENRQHDANARREARDRHT